MKRKLIIIAAVGMIATAGIATYSFTADAHECATCTPSGKGTCRACKNCRYCKHCSQNGGTCSVCK